MQLIDDLTATLDVLRAKHGVPTSELHVPLNYAQFVFDELSPGRAPLEPTDEVIVWRGGQLVVTLIAH